MNGRTTSFLTKAIASTLAMTMILSQAIMAAPVSQSMVLQTIPTQTQFLAGIDYEAVFNAMFNADEYRAMYPEIAKRVGNNKRKLFDHYMRYGLFEGKRPSATVSPQTAMVMAAQFRAILGNNASGKDTIKALKNLPQSTEVMSMVSFAMSTVQTVRDTGSLPIAVAALTGVTDDAKIAPQVIKVQQENTQKAVQIAASTSTESSSNNDDDKKESKKEEKKVDKTLSFRGLTLEYLGDTIDGRGRYILKMEGINNFPENGFDKYVLQWSNNTGDIDGVTYIEDAHTFYVDKSALSEAILLAGEVKLVDRQTNEVVCKGTIRGEASPSDNKTYDPVHEEPQTDKYEDEIYALKAAYNVLIDKTDKLADMKLAYEEASEGIDELTLKSAAARDTVAARLATLTEKITAVKNAVSELNSERPEYAAVIDALEPVNYTWDRIALEFESDGINTESYSEQQKAEMVTAWQELEDLRLQTLKSAAIKYVNAEIDQNRLEDALLDAIDNYAKVYADYMAEKSNLDSLCTRSAALHQKATELENDIKDLSWEITMADLAISSYEAEIVRAEESFDNERYDMYFGDETVEGSLANRKLALETYEAEILPRVAAAYGISESEVTHDQIMTWCENDSTESSYRYEEALSWYDVTCQTAKIYADEKNAIDRMKFEKETIGTNKTIMTSEMEKKQEVYSSLKNAESGKLKELEDAILESSAKLQEANQYGVEDGTLRAELRVAQAEYERALAAATSKDENAPGMILEDARRQIEDKLFFYGASKSNATVNAFIDIESEEGTRGQAVAKVNEAVQQMQEAEYLMIPYSYISDSISKDSPVGKMTKAEHDEAEAKANQEIAEINLEIAQIAADKATEIFEETGGTYGEDGTTPEDPAPELSYEDNSHSEEPEESTESDESEDEGDGEEDEG